MPDETYPDEIMMPRTTIFIILGVCIIAGILIAGCTQQSIPVQIPTTMPTTQGTQTGIANPASVYCGKIGGTIEIKKDAGGNEYGMCTFQNGTSCEEWALFRGEGCKAVVAVTKPTATQIGLANPASVSCGKVGGTTEIKKNADGSEYGMCKFSNGTTCEEWALFRGEGCKASGVTNTSK